MIKLKDLLLQELKKTSHVTTAAHETTAIKNVWSGRLPIYPKLMKKILGDVKINSFHTTNFEGLKNVKSTVGTKKSLSTFTALQKDSMMAAGGGVQTKGGFVLQLEGNLLISSTADIGSVPDSSGRRWIHAATLEDYFGIVPNNGFSEDSIFDAIKKADKRWFELHEKYVTWYRFHDENPEIYPWEELTGKEKAEYIKRWVDGWEKFLVANKTKFIKHFGQEVIEHSTGPGLHFGWNELIIYNIKIKDVFIVSDSYAMSTVWDNWDGRTNMRASKYSTKKEIMAAAKKVAGGKVIWGKTAGVPGFIKSRGGVIE